MISAAVPFLLLADLWGMHDSDIGAGWMIVMMLGMIVFWGLVVVGIVWLLREAIGRHDSGANAEPLAILDRRLADGQISVEEYEERKKVLAASS
jgi:putative membrane protein